MSGKERCSPLSENPHRYEDSLRRDDRRLKSTGGGGGAEEGGGQGKEEGREEEDHDKGEDSHGSRSSDEPSKLPKVIYVHRPSIHTYFRCPICLGILKKTRAVMGCLHRFCKECIDKSMRLGNKECPACRSHCASRRSLRNDTRFDAIIEMLYGDIEEYEKEELAIQEEEENHNKQVQKSIAQIFERQFARRRKMDKDTPSSSTRISPHIRKNYRKNMGVANDHQGFENNDNGNKDSSSTDEQETAIRQRKYRGKAVAQLSQPTARISLNNQKVSGRKRKISLRIKPEGSQNNEDEYNNNGNKETSLIDEQGRAIKWRKYTKRTRTPEPEGSEYNEDEYNRNANKDSSSTDEQGGRAIKLRKYKRRTGAQPSQPFQPCQLAANSDGVGIENELEVGGERKGTSPLCLLNPEMLVWGRGGARSKNVRNTRIMKLTKHLEKENDEEEEEVVTKSLHPFHSQSLLSKNLFLGVSDLRFLHLGSQYLQFKVVPCLQLAVHVRLVSLLEQEMSDLKEPYLCCSPHCSVQHIREYVTGGTQLPAEYIELLLVKKQSPLEPSTSGENKIVLLVLEGHESLVALRDSYPSDINHMLMGYRLKERG